MPTIDPSLVPSINPGDIFTRFTEDSTLNIRWLTAVDPAYYEVLNRPIVDEALRTLIIAKALDNLGISLGSQANFPFIIQPQITDGSTIADVPIRMFWDIQASMPSKWESVRLARIDRVDGENGSTYTGTLRLIFTASHESATDEIALFYADYIIDSSLTYQRVRIKAATASAVPVLSVIPSGESITIDGEIIFRTMDLTASDTTAFLDLLAPGSNAYYAVVDSEPTNPDFGTSTITNGSGMLTSSAYNLLTPVDSDPSNWLTAFNYPFDMDADLTANDSTGVVIPSAMFKEFNIVAPASDQPTAGGTGNFPVWISRLERDGSAGIPTINFYLSTYAINPADNTAVEFATFTLTNALTAGQIIAISPNDTLFPDESGSNWNQDFGRGFVVLSDEWGGDTIETFFTTFPLIADVTTNATFSSASTRIGTWGISRVPQYSPTAGQAAAMLGTMADASTPVYPSSTNRFVVSADEGLGATIDLESYPGITTHAAIERYGNVATRAHKLAQLVIDPALASESGDANFYADYILPRLTILFGRPPVFGDEYYNGNRFLKFQGSSWID